MHQAFMEYAHTRIVDGLALLFGDSVETLRVDDKLT